MMTLHVDERPPTVGDVGRGDRRVSRFWVAATAVLALAAGGLGIWAVVESGRAEDASYGVLPDYVKQQDWHIGTYASIGYSCEGTSEPDVECDAPHPANYTHVVFGNLDGARNTSDFVWLFADFEAGAARMLGELAGESDGRGGDDPSIVGSGHGIRVEQLDRAPAGLVIGGEAWIRLTVSSLPAMDYAGANGKLAPTEIGYTIEEGTEGDAPTPIPSERGGFSEELWIESMALVATNDTMSEWIIAMNQPGIYAFSAYYYQADNHPEAYSLVVRFVRL